TQALAERMRVALRDEGARKGAPGAAWPIERDRRHLDWSIEEDRTGPAHGIRLALGIEQHRLPGQLDAHFSQEVFEWVGLNQQRFHHLLQLRQRDLALLQDQSQLPGRDIQLPRQQALEVVRPGSELVEKTVHALGFHTEPLQDVRNWLQRLVRR